MLAFFLLSVLLFSTACSQLRSSSLKPLAEEAANNLKPGLVPRYFADFKARDVRELPDDTSTAYKSWTGRPVLQLDNLFGDEEVFDSGMNREIGVRLRGAISLPTAGTYSFQALSNDGIMMFLGDTLVIDDPLQHSDHLSRESSVNVTAAGWYPVRIDYFQRKGTAALQLFWTTPDNSNSTIVPAEAYGHLP
jgi:hypothetical protein